jgi:CheY-like chemotaxis protein
VSIDATSQQSEGSLNTAAIHAAAEAASGAQIGSSGAWGNGISGSGMNVRRGSSYNNRMAPSRLQMQHLQGNDTAISEDIHLSRGAKILVVEDSAAQRKMLLQRLSKADATWDITTAVSGEDALQKLKAAKLLFDIVFVDENLSVDDGLYGHELVHVMRESFKMHMCVIIACTSNVGKNKEVRECTHSVTDMDLLLFFPSFSFPPPFSFLRQSLISSGVDFVFSKPPPKPEEIKEKIESLFRAKMEQHGSYLS